MKEDRRSMIRTLATMSAGVGFFLALGAAGTSDYRETLRYEDEETREKAESVIISEKAEKAMMGTAFVALGLGGIGLALTEKKENQR